MQQSRQAQASSTERRLVAQRPAVGTLRVTDPLQSGVQIAEIGANVGTPRVEIERLAHQGFSLAGISIALADQR